MIIKTSLLAGFLTASLALAAGAADATTISWATLTAGNGSDVSGSITAGSQSVTFTADSDEPYYFANVNNSGTNFWTGAGYTYNGAYNQPMTSDIVALGLADTETISFSGPVTDLYVALNSYNGASVTFSQPYEVLSEGCGYWGCGTFVSTGADSFYGNGEAVGILEIPGTITSLTMTDTVSEYWHGFTIGIGAVGSGVPEPAAWSLMLLGLGGIGAAMRSHRRAGRGLAALEA
jgi:hypothetical protein